MADQPDALPYSGGVHGALQKGNVGIGTAASVAPVVSPCYKTDCKKRGICAVINIAKFDMHKNPKGGRAGSEVDVRRIKEVFGRGLGFEVQELHDPTSRDMEDFLWDVAGSAAHRDASCFVCFVLSHGKMGEVYTRDGSIRLRNICRPFTGSLAKTHLKGKPKLFFVQACQEMDMAATSEAEAGRCYDVPSYPDLFFGFSTPPGYYSWRSPQDGSYYIQKLCDVFEQCVRNKDSSADLLSLMSTVNRCLSFDFESYVPTKKDMHGKKQTACYFSSLRKKVRFF